MTTIPTDGTESGDLPDVMPPGMSADQVALAAMLSPKPLYVPKFCRSNACGQPFGHDGPCTRTAMACCPISKCKQLLNHAGAHDAPRNKHRAKSRRAIKRAINAPAAKAGQGSPPVAQTPVSPPSPVEVSAGGVSGDESPALTSVL